MEELFSDCTNNNFDSSNSCLTSIESKQILFLCKVRKTGLISCFSVEIE